MPNHDRNWVNTQDKAKSPDIFDRLAALTRSVFYLELAPIAIGTKRVGREGVTSLLRKSKLRDGLENLAVEDIQKAINARNQAVHEGMVPSVDKCKKLVQTIFQAWCWMRRDFVNHQTAARLAQEILKANIFYEAFLFGSLARNNKEVGDIDLLLFDNGEISFLGDLYGELRYLKSRTVLERANIEGKAFYAALDSDWIDIVVVHHELFGKNVSYVRNVASTQPPFFLLNISEGLKHYDKNQDRWIECELPPFAKWQVIQRELINEGIAPEQ